MKKENHVTAFYIEVLLLTVGLIGIVLVLTQIFALGRRESAEARELTDAVCLAQNAAEAFAASADPEELCVLLGEGGSAEVVEIGGAAAVRASYDADLKAAKDGVFLVTVIWREERADAGVLVRSRITVTGQDSTREIYSLETASFRKEAAA
jgi:hypothetical protein